MPNLTSSFLQKLNNHALPGLDGFDHFVMPKYEDQSILNIPAAICQWLNLPIVGTSPLHQEIMDRFMGDIQNILLILIDGLSFQRFVNWLPKAPVWDPFIQNGVLAPLTSVVPSTTSSSITTFWTGQSPATHGIIGYEMWLKQYAMVGNMILHSPMTFKNKTPGTLQNAGFTPQDFLDLPTLGTHLRTHEIRPISFSHYSIANSGLSKMLMTDVEVHPFQTPASLWVSVRDLILNKKDRKKYIWVYWGQLDGISHYYGPDDERVEAEFSHFSAAFEKFFLSSLEPHLRHDTLVILTSDHGQAATPLDPTYLLKHHPDLDKLLRINPTCENRFASLYLRPGAEESVREFFAKVFPGQFTLISQEQALLAGLFGPGPQHPDLTNRIGDLVAIAQDDAYLWWADQEDFLLGRHGGLHPDDMLVPFIAALI